MPSVLTIGSATQDVFLLSKAFKIIPMPGNPSVLAECITLGVKLDVDDLVIATGGGATNAAVTFAKLGFKAAVMSRIGDDDAGDSIIKELQKHAIDTSLIAVAKKEKTAHSTLLTAEHGERTALIFRGASEHFSEKDIRLSKINHTAVYLTSLGGNLTLAASIAKACKQKGALFIWNPGAHELKAGHGLDPIRKFAKILLVNLEEAQMLSQKSANDPKIQCELLALPGSITVVTDGKNGAYARSEKTTWHCRTNGVTSISSTGAGDAFGSAFTVAIINGMSIEDALRLGTMNAESVVQHVGAKAGILSAWPKATELSQYRVRKV